jgi:hypothetical protein
VIKEETREATKANGTQILEFRELDLEVDQLAVDEQCLRWRIWVWLLENTELQSEGENGTGKEGVGNEKDRLYNDTLIIKQS